MVYIPFRLAVDNVLMIGHRVGQQGQQVFRVMLQIFV